MWYTKHNVLLVGHSLVRSLIALILASLAQLASAEGGRTAIVPLACACVLPDKKDPHLFSLYAAKGEICLLFSFLICSHFALPLSSTVSAPQIENGVLTSFVFRTTDAQVTQRCVDGAFAVRLFQAFSSYSNFRTFFADVSTAIVEANETATVAEPFCGWLSLLPSQPDDASTNNATAAAATVPTAAAVLLASGGDHDDLSSPPLVVHSAAATAVEVFAVVCGCHAT